MINVRKIVSLIAIGLFFVQVASAQTGRALSVVPDKLMNAQFKSLDDSEPIRLSAYRGKVMVVVLLASWCPPCGMAMKSLNELNEGRTLNGVNLIGLTLEDPNSDADNVRAFVRNYEIKFKVGWIGEEMTKALTDGDSIPQIFIINGEGLIVKRFVGWHPAKTSKLLRRIVKQARQNPPVMQ